MVVVERAPGAGLTVGRAIGTQLRPADIAPSEWLAFRGYVFFRDPSCPI